MGFVTPPGTTVCVVAPAWAGAFNSGVHELYLQNTDSYGTLA